MHHLEYFYAPPENVQNDQITIIGQELKHLTVVMRKKRGDVIQVADGKGILYTVMIGDITKQQATCFIQKKARFHNEPMLHLTLATGIPKSSRYDTIIEKGTELGVSTFIPLISDWSVSTGSESKHKRWEKVAIAAMKQSTRCVLPTIESPKTISEVLSQPQTYDYQLIAHPGQGVKNLAHVLQKLKVNAAKTASMKKAIMLIGPEGGFTKLEVNEALAIHFHQFTLGERRLRTETASIAAAAIVMELVNSQ